MEVTREYKDQQRKSRAEKNMESIKNLQGLEIMMRFVILLIVVIVSGPVYINCILAYMTNKS